MADIGHEISAHLSRLRHLCHIVETKQDDPVVAQGAQAHVVGGAMLSADAVEPSLAWAFAGQAAFNRIDQRRLAQSCDEMTADQPLAQQIFGRRVQNRDPLFGVDRHTGQRQRCDDIGQGNGSGRHVRAV